MYTLATCKIPNPHLKCTLQICFKIKEILVSFQIVIATSSATLSLTLFASLFELAASIFAVPPVYILEMSVVHKTTMHIPVFSTLKI